MSGEDKRIGWAALEAFAQAIWTSVGMPPRDAQTQARVLVWANLRGVDSHGVQRVAEYLDKVDSGGMNPRPEIRVERETPATALIEADHAFGPVVTVMAMEKAMEKARAAGVGWVEIRNTTHQGAMAYYAQMAAAQGMAGIAIVCSPPNMAPPGARAAGVHNSPIAIAVPGNRHDCVSLDMATSVAAGGKLSVAKDRRQLIPDSWALDADGRPTTDPHRAAYLRPAGDYKGYGLAMLFECLTSVMVGNPLVSPRLRGEREAIAGTQNSLVCAVDIAAFTDVGEYRARVDQLVRGLESLPLAEGADEIMVPGEPERRILEERLARGIPLPPGTVDKLRQASARCAVPLPPELELRV